MTSIALRDEELGLLRALAFAAERHRHQRRKDALASPYVNHPIEVALHLAEVGGVRDRAVLEAAILHDVLEDTETLPAELEREFGREVCALVVALSDDPKLEQKRRKELEVSHARQIPQGAKLVKIADKTCNVRGLSASEPAAWTLERKRGYLAFARQVVAGCRGASPVLEAHFDRVAGETEAALGRAPSEEPRSTLLERAIEIAVQAHRGQVDAGGAAYVLHPLRVMAAVAAEGEHAMAAAVLHDTIEDSEFDETVLRRRGIPPEVIATVALCTRRKVGDEKESYDDFIERIAASGSPLAIAVKRADLADNLRPERLKTPLGERERARMERYRRALRRLEAALGLTERG